MTSLLAKQLKSFNAHRGFDGHGKATLLHDAKSAGHFTAEDAFQLGLEGFDLLCELDHRFERFRKELFASVPMEREKRTKEELDRIDDVISEFLKLLADYFTEAPAIKALEHLVRNYRVHVFHVDDCIACGLVYHSTAEFQRLLSLLRLKGSMWHWMSDLQKARLPFHREAIVQRCLADHAVLNFVCGMAKWSANEALRNNRVYPFFALIVCEVIENTEQVSEELMRCLISVIAAGLKSDAPIEFRQSIHMIIAQLCTKASLSEKAIKAMLKSLLERNTKKETAQVVVIVCHIYNTQTHFTQAPEDILQLLAEIEDLSSTLGTLMIRGLDANRLLSVILKELVGRVASEENSSAEAFLERLISNAPLDKHVESIASAMFEQLQESSMPAMRNILRELDVHYPILLDQSVNVFLKNEKRDEKKQHVLTLLYGAPNEVVHSKVQGTDMTLLHAADAPDAATRMTALEQLQSISNSDLNSEVSSLLGAMLIRRLMDEEFGVAAAAVQCNLDMIIDVPALIAALAHLMRSAMERVRQGESLGESTVARTVDYLTANKASRFSAVSEQIVLLLLEHSFAFCQHEASTSRKIIYGLSLVQHPLTRVFATTVKAMSKIPEKDSFRDLNQILMEHIAGWESEIMRTVLSHCGLRLRCFLCSAIEQFATKENAAQDKKHVVQCILTQLRELNQRQSGQANDPDCVQLTEDTSVCFNAALVRALGALVPFSDVVPSSVHPDDASVHEMFALVLRQTGCDDAVIQCCKAMLNATGGECKLSFLLHYLCLPSHDANTHTVLKGLSVFRSCLREGVSDDDLEGCVIPLCTLLSHCEESVRKMAFKGFQKLQLPTSTTATFVAAVATLVNYLKDNEESIRSDAGALKHLMSELLSVSEEGVHVPKKQKTLKEHALQSGESACLRQFFVNQLQQLSPSSYPRQLRTLFACLRRSMRDVTLLMISLPVLQKGMHMKPTGEETELVCDIASLFYIGVVSDLADIEKGKQAMEALVRCLSFSCMDRVKHTVLDLMSRKWMKAAQSACWSDILMGVLKCANTDRDPDIARKAASVAVKSPLLRKQLEECLSLDTHDDKMEESCVGTRQERCLWMLDLLQAKVDVSEHLEVGTLLQRLLSQIYEQTGGCENIDELIIQISRSAFGVLESVAKRKNNASNDAVMDMELVVKYLRWTSDPVLRETILSLLQCVPSSTTTHTLKHVVAVLQDGSLDMGRDHAEFELQQIAAAVTAIIRSKVEDKNSVVDIWSALAPAVLTLADRQRVTILNAIFRGFSVSKKSEGLSVGMVALLSNDSVDSALDKDRRLSVALQLLKTADLTERNHAIALAMREMDEHRAKASSADLLQSVLQLTISTLTTSVSAGVVLSTPNSNLNEHFSDGLGFGSILVEATKQLSRRNVDETRSLTDKHPENSVNALLQQILKFLRRCMDSNSYLLVTMTTSTDVCIQVCVRQTLVYMIKTLDKSSWCTVLQMFSGRLYEITQKEDRGEWNVSEDVCDVCPHLLSVIHSDRSENALLVHLALSSVQHLVDMFASKQPKKFKEWIPVVAELTTETNTELRGGALACMASFLRELGESTVQYLPVFVPAVLESMDLCLTGDSEDMKDEETEWLDLLSGLAVVGALLEGVGAYLSPHLIRVLRIVLDPRMPDLPSVTTLLGSVTESIVRHVPLRLLLPVLLDAYAWVQEENTGSLVKYLKLVDNMVSSMTIAMAEQYQSKMVGFFLGAFELRRLERIPFVETLAIEQSVSTTFLTFVMKLNEEQFKPVLDAFLDWMFKDPSSVARQTTGFHILSELAQRLKPLFVVYVPTFLDNALELAVTEVKKKAWTDERPDAKLCNLYMLKFFIVQCLCRSLQYDEDDVLDQQQMQKIIPVALKLLRKCRTPSEVFIDGIGDVKDADHQFVGSETCGRDYLSIAVCALLIQLGGRSALQKSVTNKVLKCCTKGGSTYMRVLALCIVREIVSLARDEFAPLFPETLPRIAEMLEVREKKIHSIAQEIVKLFEEITGEDFEQHIQQN